MERLLAVCRFAGRGQGRCLARPGSEIGPGLRLRQALGGGLSVPPRDPMQRRQRRAAVADRGTGGDADCIHREARRDPGRGPDLGPKAGDRRVRRACDDFRARRGPVADGELEQGALQRNGSAGDPAARLGCVRRPIDRPGQRIGADAAGARQARRTAWPACRGDALRPPGDRDDAEDFARQRAGSACADGAAVRRRRAGDAERLEGFCAKTLAGAVS